MNQGLLKQKKGSLIHENSDSGSSVINSMHLQEWIQKIS